MAQLPAPLVAIKATDTREKITVTLELAARIMPAFLTRRNPVTDPATSAVDAAHSLLAAYNKSVGAV